MELESKNEIEAYLKQIEQNIQQLRLIAFDMEMIGLQLADGDRDNPKMSELKENLKNKYENMKSELNKIYHEDENAEHLLDRIRELIW